VFLVVVGKMPTLRSLRSLREILPCSPLLKILFILSKTPPPRENFPLKERGLPARVSGGGGQDAHPPFVALCFIEMSDIIFAVDSVPAILAITKEPLLVFTSNIFAILGLRAMYFLLAGFVHKFRFLKYGLGVVLIFVGLKMVWLNAAFDGKFPISWSLGIIPDLAIERDGCRCEAQARLFLWGAAVVIYCKP